MTSPNQTMDAESYLTKHQIDFYMRDAVKLMLQCKSLKVKVQPPQFLHQYFKSVKYGTHIIYRDYSYIKGTAWNRKSFLRKFWSSFNHFQRSGNLFSSKDCHALLCILCPDFVEDMVRKTVDIILVEDAADSVMLFTDFMYAFQFRFYYDEFSKKCYELFNEHSIPMGSQKCEKDCEVLSKVILKFLEESFYNNATFQNLNVPPLTIVQRILQSSPSMSLYKFLTMLCKSDELTKEIGAIGYRETMYSTKD